MHVLVADDEKLARDSICQLLASRPDITQVSCAEDGTQAAKIVQQNDATILFLDISMPGLSGVEVAKQATPKQSVIFTTAYDHYAVQAFELNAADYILKPYSDERFFQALDKAMDVQNKVQPDFEKMAKLLAQATPKRQETSVSKLVLRESKKVKLFDFNDIAFIRGAGNYIEVIEIDGKKHLFRETLSKVESQLKHTAFVRIHKSTIVRSDLICELISSGKGTDQFR